MITTVNQEQVVKLNFFNGFFKFMLLLIVNVKLENDPVY